MVLRFPLINFFQSMQLLETLRAERFKTVLGTTGVMAKNFRPNSLADHLRNGGYGCRTFLRLGVKEIFSAEASKVFGE
jgi:hypothetical protein